MGVSGQRHSPPRFTPGERTPGTHWEGGWEGPRAGLDTEATGKIIFICPGSNLDHPVVQSVARHYTNWASPAPQYKKSSGNILSHLINKNHTKMIYISSFMF
jgi:hypothetical protein